MTFRVHVDSLAERELADFASYTVGYSEEFAVQQLDRLDRILSFELASYPLRWSYFPLTGAPYRAYLFRVGRHTQYWIIYTVDEDRRIVTVLRFWNASRDPEALDL